MQININFKFLSLAMISLGFLFVSIGLLYPFNRVENNTASNSSNQTFTPTQLKNSSDNPSSISIPYLQYASANWNKYGVGQDTAADAARLGSVQHLWMSAVGSITYEANLPKTKKDLVISVGLSSELLNRRSDKKTDSSDVSVIINGKTQVKTNVIPDNASGGKDYEWIIPNEDFQTGTNTITFRVGDGRYKNGLAIYSPIRLSFR
jgi:hypothetical protein